MSAAQNVIDNLQSRRHELMLRLNELQAGAQRAAFEAVVHDSWTARQRFRDIEHEADRLSEEIGMLDLAIAEAYARLQTRGRDAGEVMRELKFTGATVQEYQSPSFWGRLRYRTYRHPLVMFGIDQSAFVVTRRWPGRNAGAQ
jgi:hypothetical protein